MEQKIFGGYDEIEYDGIDELAGLINIIKALDDRAYKFVMTNAMRRTDN